MIRIMYSYENELLSIFFKNIVGVVHTGAHVKQFLPLGHEGT